MFNLKNELNNISDYYPKLKVKESDGKLFLSGEVDLFHPIENKIIDTFSLDIIFPNYYPFCFPLVIETSGKIERKKDRHIHEKTNNMCFAVIAEELLKCRFGITAKWFLDKIVVPRLAEEYIVNQGGEYAHEFSHGTKGDLEFYLKKFNTNTSSEVIRYLQLILAGNFPKSYEKCCCGSGVKFKKCHRIMFEEMKGLGDKFISHEIDKIVSFLNK